MQLERIHGFQVEYVDEPAGLGRVLAALDAVDRACLDMEADSMHHFYAKICLVQILAGDRCFLVDPLAGLDLKPLLDRLAAKFLVFHGADYDLRMLYQHYGFRPREIFDTMLAAQLLGKKAFGLAALVQDYFGVTLEKEQQKADWSRRPLSDEMLAYGAQDTFFLPGLHAKMGRELAEKGRQDWHRETCAALVAATARIKEVDTDNLWRIDGSSKFHPRQLAVVKALWHCRNAIAQELDYPSYRVLPSDVILRYALATPTEGEPERLPLLPSRLTPEQRQAFKDAYAEALALSPREWPQPLKFPKRSQPSPNSQLLANLKQVRDETAQSLGLDPSLLATKSTLTAVALTGCVSEEKIREAARWMKWQEDLLMGPWRRYALPEKKRRGQGDGGRAALADAGSADADEGEAVDGPIESDPELSEN